MSDEREISAHYLDDPDYDIAEDHADERGWGFLFAHLVLALVSLSAWAYFHQPVAPNVTIQLSDGQRWKVNGPVAIDEFARALTCPTPKPWYEEMPWDKKDGTR